MGFFVSLGAELICPFGMAPSTLIVIPEGTLVNATTPAATILDFVPIENIPPFGMCMSPLNPEVIAATAAALGVLTPMPCIPVTTPWAPGAPTVLINGIPALTDDSICECAWGGVIMVTDPGQVSVVSPE